MLFRSSEAAALADHWGGTQQSSPGTVLALVDGVGAVVASGGCPVLLREAQLEGKRPAAGTSLVQQLQLKVGDNLSDHGLAEG